MLSCIKGLSTIAIVMDFDETSNMVQECTEVSTNKVSSVSMRSLASASMSTNSGVPSVYLSDKISTVGQGTAGKCWSNGDYETFMATKSDFMNSGTRSLSLNKLQLCRLPICDKRYIAVGNKCLWFWELVQRPAEIIILKTIVWWFQRGQISVSILRKKLLLR